MNLCTMHGEKKKKFWLVFCHGDGGERRRRQRQQPLCMDSVWEKHPFFPHFVFFICSAWRICLFKASNCFTLIHCSLPPLFSLLCVSLFFFYSFIFHLPSFPSLWAPAIVWELWLLTFDLLYNWTRTCILSLGAAVIQSASFSQSKSFFFSFFPQKQKRGCRVRWSSSASDFPSFLLLFFFFFTFKFQPERKELLKAIQPSQQTYNCCVKISI